MQILKSTHTDAAYNLACEEILFEQEEDCIYIWQNDRSVIIGRNQNAYAEVNLHIAKQYHTRIIRRCTGGGAVYHDLGNVNFSFCFFESHYNKEIFVQAILDFLRTLEIPAELSGRNDILVNGKKISGCAELTRNGRTLFHGTLLFQADTEHMQQLLNVSAEKLSSKGINSVKSRVIGIKDYLPNDWNVQMLIQKLHEYLQNKFNAVSTYVDSACILQLAKEKYSNHEWNFGKNPKMELTQGKRFSIGEIQVSLRIEKNRIEECIFEGDFIGRFSVQQLAQRLVHQPYEKTALIQFLKMQNLYDYFGCISAEELAELFFPN